MRRGRVLAAGCMVGALVAGTVVAAQPSPARPAGATSGELTAPALPPPLSAQGGEVFRSVDDNGTPSFSQVPPAGRPSHPVDLRPLSGSIEPPRPLARPPAAVGREGPAPGAAEPARGTEASRAGPRPGPRGMSFETFIRVQRGMSEGELLARAGPPDHRGEEVNRGLVQESWYYLPTVGDPFTTIIQLRGGRVVSTERVRQL